MKKSTIVEIIYFNKLFFLILWVTDSFVAAGVLDVSQLVKMFWFLSLCSDLFVVVLSLFIFSALTLTFQLFTHKLCLQISGLRMGNFTWNPFPINICWFDTLLTPSWRVRTWVYFWRILVTRSQLLTTPRTQMANSACLQPTAPSHTFSSSSQVRVEFPENIGYFRWNRPDAGARPPK